MGLNRIESSKVVYKNYSIKELVEIVYSQLIDLTSVSKVGLMATMLE